VVTIWTLMLGMTLLYLLHISKGLALHLGQYLHLLRMDLTEKRNTELRKLHDYHHQELVFLLPLLKLKKILKHR
jgi:hypothetical protein